MKKFSVIIYLILIIPSFVYSQIGVDASLRRIGFHTGNRAGISFYNDGQIAGFNVGTDIRGEWPLGSGENYIGDLIPLIAVEFVNTNGDTLHSVCISRGPRNRQGEEKHPVFGYFWGFNPIAGFLNTNEQSVAMSHKPESWPIGGWADPGGFPEVQNYIDADGNTEWWGYFGRGIINADQESFFVANDQADDEFNGLNDAGEATLFAPDSNDLFRHGMGLQLRQRGFQWSSFLAEDAIFWLYDIKNEGTTTFRKANFGTVVGTLAGGDGDSGDDLGFFDAKDWITYSWDSDGIGNRGQQVGYVGYSFLESPGNPFDGIDNDGDSENPSSPRFVETDFDSVTYNPGDRVVLIDPDTYERTLYTVKSVTDTVYSLGEAFVIVPGVTKFLEGDFRINTSGTSGDVFIPGPTALDGLDNDLDGLVDESYVLHYRTRIIDEQGNIIPGAEGLAYKNYVTGAGLNDLLIDERRDNDIDEDGDWSPDTDDLGQDGLGPEDEGYPGPDLGEGDGFPTQGEPNFGRTDPDESDQIGLTAFNFFNISASPDMTNDSLLWARMLPGRFDVIPAQPQDGDFIYASGYFPLPPEDLAINQSGVERFSVSLLFGEDFNDIFGNKKIVQQIYNAGYKFPQPPKKPEITLTQSDGKVVIYWDSERVEESRDFITKSKDFQGYKIYRATDAGFQDSRSITNALGVLSFDRPLAQYDKVDSLSGFFYPSPELLSQVGGTTFYLGDNNGIVNKFVDSTAVNGVRYFYAVCAYDSGVDTLDIFPSENSKFIFIENTGQIQTDVNTGYITPSTRPVGYMPAQTNDFVKNEDFKGTGRIELELVDDEKVRPEINYQIEFQDSALQGFTKNYSLIDLVSPDTVYVPSINETYIVKPTESITLPQGTDTILVNGTKTAVDTNVYTAAYDTLIGKSKVFNGNTKIVHGFRPQIYNDSRVIRDTALSGFKNIGSSPPPTYTFKKFEANKPGQPSVIGVDMPYDYVVEFYNTIVDTSLADTLFMPPIPSNIIPSREVNFKVKNLTTGQYIDFAYLTFGTLASGYSIWFKENIQGQVYRTWRIDIQYRTPNTPLESQGTLEIYTRKPFSRSDILQFSIKAASMDNSLTSADLDRIKVVPNPYIATHAGEPRLLSTQTSGRGERNIRFTHVPPNAKISIFTVRGEKIKTLTHEELYTGDVFWNLRTEENLDVAYGVYVFVVEVPNIGTKVGKFALIK